MISIAPHRFHHNFLHSVTVRYILAALVLCGLPVKADSEQVNPVEVGDVRWSRDYYGSLNRSRQTGKPIFMLFQEVPGCIGCQNFGQMVLTHPLLVEAIEEEFIPVLVYNNRSSGMDKELLKRFEEPSWNYQVIRFIDGDQQDVIPRRDQVWDIGGVAGRMIEALEASGRIPPRYLHAIAVEHDRHGLERAVFAMACFWTGEYQLGSIDGVVSTEAGWYGGREVTMVNFNHHQLTLERLAEEAAARKCAQRVYIESEPVQGLENLDVRPFDRAQYQPARPSDQKKQIRQWLAENDDLYLTPMQATKLNALMGHDIKAAYSWLSPRQLSQLAP